MSSERWTAVDHYLDDLLVRPDAALQAAADACIAANLPPISVTPAQGKLLYLLARLHGARSILEIGTLGGYSTLWFARALPPGGRVVTLEIDPRHADVARANFSRAGLSTAIDLRLGPALDTLPQLAAAGAGPFDLVFVDADKPSNPDYFTWAMKLTRPGSLILVDNVVRGGKVIDADSSDANVQGVRRMNELVAAEPRVSATTIQTVGSKGYDGFLLALVNAAV